MTAETQVWRRVYCYGCGRAWWDTPDPADTRCGCRCPKSHPYDGKWVYDPGFRIPPSAWAPGEVERAAYADHGWLIPKSRPMLALYSASEHHTWLYRATLPLWAARCWWLSGGHVAALHQVIDATEDLAEWLERRLP